MDKSLELLRHELSSLNLKDFEHKEMTENERREYVAAISAIFPRLERDIKEHLYDQLMFMSLESENMDQIWFGRGTYNGLKLLLEHWKQAHIEHQGRKVDDRPEDLNSPLGEI